MKGFWRRWRQRVRKPKVSCIQCGRELSPGENHYVPANHSGLPFYMCWTPEARQKFLRYWGTGDSEF